MRPPQHTLSAAELQHLFADLLIAVLGPWPLARRCTAAVVVRILAYAAARITSVTDACLRLVDAPDADTVLGHLARQLPSADGLDRRLQAALIDHLPRAIRRGRWIIAVDSTLIPYHGRPFAEAAEIYRGQPKSGTTHFHAYATAYLVRNGRRFTLALVWVRHGTTPADVVRELHRRVRAAGVKLRLVLLDRGFNNAGVVRYLQSARQPFVMPQAVHGKAPKDGRLAGLRAIRTRHPTGWTTYSWTPNGQRRVSVDLCVVRRRRRDRRGHRAFLYASWGVRRTPATVYRTYRLRFGIETSYRQMNQARIRTTTRRPALRLLFVGVAILLRNLWAWLHWVVLAARRPGGRRLRLERLRFRTLMLWLMHLAERALGSSDPAESEAPPTDNLGPPHDRRR
jgi:Transposase DDE domain